MEPYYADGTCTLYHGDAREILPTLPHAAADLIVTDPPYGVRWRSKWRTARFDRLTGDDGTLDVPDVLGLALPALRQHRHLYVFGDFDLSALPLSSPVALIWDKGLTGLGNFALPWGPSHELIAFAVYTPSPAERARGDGRLSARLRKGSVIRCPRLNAGQVAAHPTEKPVPLLRQLIESSSLIGETVLDPFAGSGSTLEAARLEGRHAIGIEIEERYCEATARRLAQDVLTEARSLSP